MICAGHLYFRVFCLKQLHTSEQTFKTMQQFCFQPSDQVPVCYRDFAKSRGGKRHIYKQENHSILMQKINKIKKINNAMVSSKV